VVEAARFIGACSDADRPARAGRLVDGADDLKGFTRKS
jgi:hypothetical protein